VLVHSGHLTRMKMKDGVPPLPPHWIFDGEPDSPNYTGSLVQKAVLAFHRTLALVTFGVGSLRPTWERCHLAYHDEGIWAEGRDSLRERIQHTNVVGGLLLTTIATFCSTDPPKDSAFLPYTKQGPTCLFLAALGLSFAGLIVGSTIVLVVGKADPTWFCDVMMGTRARIWITMILLGYPFWAIGASTCSLAAGLLVAASYSESALIRYGGYALVASPLSCGVVFAWMLSVESGVKKEDVEKVGEVHLTV